MKKQILLSIVLTFAFMSKIYAFQSNQFGSLKDERDGKIYKTLKIGKKEWMAQNINYKAENSFAIKNDESLSENMGRLYTWKAVESKSICPKGWHVPTNKEWGALLKALKMKSYKTDKDDNTDYYKEVVAVFEKIGFVDKYTFAGIYHDITDEPEFKYTGKIAMFWTSSTAGKTMNMNEAFNISMYNDLFEGEKGVLLYGTTFRDLTAISCRCIKD
jgi:uncharacterized protein (TIGR02145 family)